MRGFGHKQKASVLVFVFAGLAKCVFAIVSADAVQGFVSVPGGPAEAAPIRLRCTEAQEPSSRRSDIKHQQCSSTT